MPDGLLDPWIWEWQFRQLRPETCDWGARPPMYVCPPYGEPAWWLVSWHS
jgi:hypothetical protein